jgi:hypothetical protein
MATQQLEIFLSSRFAEFSELRAALKEQIQTWLGGAFELKVIDLNDELARSKPPRAVCAELVKRSDVVLLLLGDTYGACAPGMDISHTHLEYRAAKEAARQIPVIAAMLSDEPAQGDAAPEIEPRMQAFRKEVLDAMTPTFLRRDEPLAEQAFRLVKSLHVLLVEHLESQREGGIEADLTGSDDDSEDRPIHASHLYKLEAQKQQNSPEYEISKRLAYEIQPESKAAIEAHEQRLLADRARAMGETAMSLTHLTRSLHAVPLQPTVQYERAMMLAKPRASRKELQEAKAQLTQCERVFRRLSLPFWRSASLIGLAKVHLLIDAADVATAVALAEQANEAPAYMPNFDFRRAGYEHARLLMLDNQREKALSVLSRLSRVAKSYLMMAHRDAAFAVCRRDIDALLGEERSRCRELAQKMQDLARLLQPALEWLKRSHADTPACPSLPPAFNDLSALGMQAAIRDQFDALTNWLNQCCQLVAREKKAVDAIHEYQSLPGRDEPCRLAGQLRITRWHVAPGSALREGAPLFDFVKADGSGASRTYTASAALEGTTVQALRATAGAQITQGTSLLKVCKLPKANSRLAMLCLAMQNADAALQQHEHMAPEVSPQNLALLSAGTLGLGGLAFMLTHSVLPGAAALFVGLAACWALRQQAHQKHADVKVTLAGSAQLAKEAFHQECLSLDASVRCCRDAIVAFETLVNTQLKNGMVEDLPFTALHKAQRNNWVVVPTDESGHITHRNTDIRGTLRYGSLYPAPSSGRHIARVSQSSAEGLVLDHIGLADPS